MPPLPENNLPIQGRTTIPIKETLKEVIKEVVDSREPIRPKSARAMSRYPYYKERFALEYKVVLDDMISEHDNGVKEDRMYWYRDFVDLRPSTLYLRITQAKQFLLDNMDPEGKYARFCELLATKIERGKGIRLFYARDVVNGSFFRPTKVVVKEESHTYKDRVHEFLENALSGEKLNIEKLVLSEEEIQTLDASLVILENIIYKITHKTIFIAKL